MNSTKKNTIRHDPAEVAPLVRVLIALLVIGLGLGLVYVILSLPSVAVSLKQVVNEHLPQSGVTNPVTAVLLNFRGYDTLLEMVVLLVALLGVWALGDVAHFQDQTPGPVLDTLARLMAPVLIIVAAYLLWVGADAAGGAFQAGSVLGAAGVLLLLAGWRPPIALMALPLRLVLIIGAAAFVTIALFTLVSNGQLLAYPDNKAGLLILVLEAAATVSIGVTLAALFVGGQPQDEQHK